MLTSLSIERSFTYVIIGAFAFLLIACETGTQTSGPCDNQKSIFFGKVLGPGDMFSMQTPDAENSCEATYDFKFSWHDFSTFHTNWQMPPLLNLEHAFQPSGEFAYFPHMPPTQSDKNVWSINFQIGNRNGNNPTQYGVWVMMDPSANPKDSIDVTCMIIYKPFQH